MKCQACRNFARTLWAVVVTFLITLPSILGPAGSEAIAHGGKSHGGETFTALQALQKATELYDRLIVSGKLDESWETGLQNAEVTARDNNGIKEYRVGFHRKEGNPIAVYIFLSSEGKYSGSNHDGKW